MEFITAEIATELGLTEAQVTSIKEKGSNYIADLQKGWDNKANENAEGILNGAISKIVETTKVPRNQGEKVADYIERASNSHLSTLKTDLETAKLDYAQKLKDFKGDDATKLELENAKLELDKAKQTLANFDEIKAKADKYEPLETEYKNMKLQIAFQSVKPNFPETVNSYEAKAKWEEFISGVQNKYTIELVDGVAVCKDKDNEYKTVKLSELVTKDEELSKLSQGRVQQGVGAKQVDKVKIDGVPFEVAKDATSEERSKAIQEHLLKEGIAKTSPEYAKKFKEFHDLIVKGGK
jgi:hypothetical protein